MRTTMIYPIRFWALLLSCLLIYQFSTSASADGCKLEKDIDLTLDVSASDVLAISAAADDLDIVGVSGSMQAVISYAWLDLHIDVPQELALEIKDGSGDIRSSNITGKVEIPQKG